MKKKRASLLAVLLLFCIQFSFSQNCEAISPYKKGMSLEYTNYNKKGKVTSVEKHFIKEVNHTSGNLAIHIETSMLKGKNKAGNNTYILRCEDGNFFIDMANYISHNQNGQKGSFSINAKGDFLEFPPNMTTETVLKDGTISLQIGDSDASLSISEMKVLNRKVIERSDLTTPAGTFKGYKMKFDYLFEMGFIKFRGSGVEWYVEGIGIIRTESYSKKGKLKWVRELTKMNTI
ncbi:hypothetical protein ACFSTE_16560 [Aquimarina hainanensis]|uniref:DUF3108 domain-containing protein n=1 Tax=Aquimarina hainanensis TaxID=1578017 RepID=A0ABW5NC53_9FLAO|nr:hypothetical protein [Aquimarina sp. TRL1]QKX07035.1 hypothetical protein HN014_19665 [Aquimarina sp. TRL1]